MKEPGVDVEEFERGPRPIEGVGTSTAGMAGETERGPVQPRLVTSWSDYQQWFGGAVSGAFLPFAVQGFFENGGLRLFVARVVGAGTTPQIADFVGDRQRPAGERTGLAALEDIGEISLLLVPDEVRDSTGAITGAVVDQCERLKDRFAIVSANANQDDIETLRPPRDSSFGAFFYPWIRVHDAALNEAVLVPPGGHVAGIYARTDVVRGVHKAPANEVVRGLFSGGAGDLPPLEFTITDREQDIVNPRGVNVIRDFGKQGRGVLLWGARTMSSDPEWKYVNVRRLLAYIQESIATGTRWVVFEPNTEPTWSLFERHVTIFLGRLWRDGMLMGSTEHQAYFVRCDRSTMTQDDIDNGRLIGLIGVAPIKPAEFVIFRIGQKTAGSGNSDP